MSKPRKAVARNSVPCALTIAGSDSGGGAGIQADLKTFAVLGVHGTSVITCVTAQNPREVRAVAPIRLQIVQEQIQAVLTELPPNAIKTGMLYSAPIIDLVAALPKTCRLIVDPVMISTSGAVLLKRDAVNVLKKKLLPAADLITPNLSETEFLLERKIRSPEQLRSAARELFEKYGCAVLAKGGHLPGKTAIDFYIDAQTELLLEAPRVFGVSTHGTGCTYSAAIAAYSALGRSLPDAVQAAKDFITTAIFASYKAAGHWVLNPLAMLQ
jgi:hydroxymethylpyrimidine kinase/phosphomethylpyrimidine kinase